MKNSNSKKSCASKTMKTYITLRQRIVGTFMALFMLLQICIPGIASAAIIISDDSITKAMTSQLFESSSDPGYMYKQASYLSNQAVVAKTVTDFYNELRAAKVPVGAPMYVPIAGDVTVFVPFYTPGKLIGDTYVQTRYIRDQITDLLGRHMIDAANDADEYIQIKRLYDNAKTFAINNNATYKFGDNLPATLTVALDMIWPERRVINGQSVVVPIVYLKPETIAKYQVNDHKIEFLGGVAEFKSIVLDDVKLTTGRESVIKTGQLLSYNGSVTSGGNLTLMVGGTLNNIGGVISVAGNLNIISGQLNNKTVLVPYADKFGSGTRLGRIAKIEAGNNLNVYSKNDIALEGSTLKSINGSITLNAGGNINIAPVYIQNQGTSKEGQWQVSSSSLNVYGSKLTAAENIKLIADGAVNITASELIATKGGIEILASQGIHIIDGLNQEQIQKVDRKGKTRGQSSEFRTEAVRAVLNSGKGVLLDSEHGDVVLKATDISTTTGAQVAARNGKVHLLMTKELEEFHLQTVRKGTWTIKTKTVDIIHENNIQNTIVGGLQVQAKYGINVEYTGKEGATLREQVEEFRRMPGMEWMAALYDQSMSSPGQSVNWEVMEEVHKELKKTKRALSPAAMAIIAICMAVVMGPGVGLIGPGGGGVIGGMAANATIGAALNAGALALATQAAQSLAAGNNLRETLNAMDSDESLKSLAIAMVTAGALENTDFKMFEVADDAKASVAILQQAGQAVTNSVVSAGISVAISGGNTKDFESAFVQSLAMNAISKLGEKMANKIGIAYRNDEINNVIRYVAHAGAGCILGAATGATNDSDEELSCLSGAGGAVVGELVADSYKESQIEALFDDQKAKVEALKAQGKTPEQIVKELTSPAQQEYYNKRVDEIRATGVDLAKLSAGFAAILANGDVNIAAMTAENAAKNNALFLLPLAVMALKAIDIALTAGDLWKIYVAYQTGGATAGLPLLLAFLGDGATDKLIGVVIPGFKTAEELLEWLRKNDYISDGMLDSVRKVFSENHSKAGTDGNSNFVGVDISNKQVIAVNAGSKGSWDKTINGKLEPNAAYKLDNGHVYVTDSNGRVMNVGGDLDGIKLDRNKHQQLLVGKSENGSGYDGGHLIATQLGGAGDKINLVPMTVGVNRGAYLQMENQLAKDLLDGKNVSVKIDVGYPTSNSVTPNVLRVTSYVDGVEKVHTFIQ